MPKNILLSGDLTVGHTIGSHYFPPTPITAVVSHLTIAGQNVVVTGDQIVPHRATDDHDIIHGGTVTGSSHMTIGGASIAVTGDPVSCGDTCGMGSSTHMTIG